jgi:hypothetical protein
MDIAMSVPASVLNSALCQRIIFKGEDDFAVITPSAHRYRSASHSEKTGTKTEDVA